MSQDDGSGLSNCEYKLQLANREIRDLQHQLMTFEVKPPKFGHMTTRYEEPQRRAKFGGRRRSRRKIKRKKSRRFT